MFCIEFFSFLRKYSVILHSTIYLNEIRFSLELNYKFQKMMLSIDLMFFYLYSFKMDENINALENKINQLIIVCDKLRNDNISIRQKYIQSRNENDKLKNKIQNVKDRIRNLIKLSS